MPRNVNSRDTTIAHVIRQLTYQQWRNEWPREMNIVKQMRNTSHRRIMVSVRRRCHSRVEPGTTRTPCPREMRSAARFSHAHDSPRAAALRRAVRCCACSAASAASRDVASLPYALPRLPPPGSTRVRPPPPAPPRRPAIFRRRRHALQVTGEHRSEERRSRRHQQRTNECGRTMQVPPRRRK